MKPNDFRTIALRMQDAIEGEHMAHPDFRVNGRIFAIARTVPDLDAIRISVGFFTTVEEIERVATTVELLAAHTPATLPQRPRLAILSQGEG
jgi:selenocysteine lyase/cysteine desulfurase